MILEQPAAMRATRRPIPSFSLYGEQSSAEEPMDGIHIEDIPSRSRKYLWKIGTHRHTRLSQCLFVAIGPVTATLDETLSNLTGPAVMIIPAGTVHSFRFRADSEGFILTVDLDRLLRVTSVLHQSPIQALFSAPCAVDLRDDPNLAGRVGQLLDRLHQESAQPDSTTAPVANWLACAVLWILAKRVPTGAALEVSSGQDMSRLRLFRELIESYYLRHWPVRRYAQRLALSETSLNRVCLRLTGSTAFNLIQQRLAREARRRLVYVATSVSGIGTELGFKDPAYFSRFFRRHVGISPNEFKRLHGGG